MKAGLAIALIFLARFAAGAWFDPGRDGDVAWQHWLGLQILQTGHLPLALGREAYTAAGAPWVPQEWALSLAIALTLNTPAFILLVAITALAGFSVLLLTARASRILGASTIATAIAVFCVGFSMLESYGIRAQVFAWALLAAVMFVLRCVQGRSRWWIVVLVALWANLHASALLAPALLLLWTAGIAVQERAWSANLRQHLLLTLASGAAVFATPLGYRLPLYTIALIHSPIRTAINEWQPSDFTAPSFTFGALPLMLAMLFFSLRGPRRWSEIFVSAAVAWLAITAVRNVPVCAIVIAPFVAARLSEYLPERLRVNTIFLERPVTALLYVGCLFAALVSALSLAVTPEFKNGNLPVRAIAALAAEPGTHHVYCEDFAWCSLALAYPNLREFIDGRCDPFPLTVWKDYETVFYAKRGWREVLTRRGVDAIVVDKKRTLARALPSWHDWRLVYADARYRLFVRERSGSTAYHQQ